MLLKTYPKTAKPKGEDGEMVKCPSHSLDVGGVAVTVAEDFARWGRLWVLGLIQTYGKDVMAGISTRIKVN